MGKYTSFSWAFPFIFVKGAFPPKPLDPVIGKTVGVFAVGHLTSRSNSMLARLTLPESLSIAA